MDPWFVTGFIDGEGCFVLSIIRNNKLKTSWEVQLFFKIGLHEKDKVLLKQLQTYFCVGSIYKRGSESLEYRIQSVKDLKSIIKHLEKFPLITQKRADYLLFVQAFNLILNKEHLTMEGLAKLVAIKASINLGISSELKDAFPNIVPVSKPKIINQNILDPLWVAGFTTGEGCFYINLPKSVSHKLKERVQLVFKLTQQGVSPPEMSN